MYLCSKLLYLFAPYPSLPFASSPPPRPAHCSDGRLPHQTLQARLVGCIAAPRVSPTPQAQTNRVRAPGRPPYACQAVAVVLCTVKSAIFFVVSASPRPRESSLSNHTKHACFQVSCCRHGHARLRRFGARSRCRHATLPRSRTPSTDTPGETSFARNCHPQIPRGQALATAHKSWSSC